MEKTINSKSTFIVKVQFCQNSSWQGTVAWTEHKKEKRFRSTLELIKLIDEAITVGQHDEESLMQWE